MGQYTSIEAVKVRLQGKVQFTDDPEATGEDGKMTLALLTNLISEAEGQVEMDLSPRYLAPFATTNGQPFANLPARPTRAIIKTLCELMSAMRVLETDSGRASASDGSKYFETQAKRYKAIVFGAETEDGASLTPGLMSHKKGTYNTYALPPLPGLKLNYQNKADTGFHGVVVNDSNFGDGNFPAGQINDPSEGFFNATLDDPDGNIG